MAPVQLNITDEVRRHAETVVMKYMSDQTRYPQVAGTPFVTSASEFDFFIDALREANPRLPSDKLHIHALKHDKDSGVADAIMEIVNQAAEGLKKNGHEVPAIPNLFERQAPARGTARG